MLLSPYQLIAIEGLVGWLGAALMVDAVGTHPTIPFDLLRLRILSPLFSRYMT